MAELLERHLEAGERAALDPAVQRLGPLLGPDEAVIRLTPCTYAGGLGLLAVTNRALHYVPAERNSQGARWDARDLRSARRDGPGSRGIEVRTRAGAPYRFDDLGAGGWPGDFATIVSRVAHAGPEAARRTAADYDIHRTRLMLAKEDLARRNSSRETSSWKEMLPSHHGSGSAENKQVVIGVAALILLVTLIVGGRFAVRQVMQRVLNPPTHQEGDCVILTEAGFGSIGNDLRGVDCSPSGFTPEGYRIYRVVKRLNGSDRSCESEMGLALGGIEFSHEPENVTYCLASS